MKKLLLGIFVGLLAFSCSKDDKQEKVLFQIMLTDGPARYDSVLINVENIEYHVSDDMSEGAWHTFDFVNAGVYNLLDFTGGLDTLVAEDTLPEGRISQIRLILGDGNQIVKDGEYHELSTPSALTSGLKFQVNADLKTGIIYRLWIDFDAERSVVETGNGKFILKPVIRTYTESNSGAVEGVVSPAESKAYVMSISEEDDTTGTYADTITGKFLLPGLEPGNYTVVVEPDSGYLGAQVDDVLVTLGKITQIDTIYIEEQ